MTFDAMGRETSVTYPDGVTVKNAYDASVLSAVQSADGTLSYATLAYSAAVPGKLSSVLYGNGMSTQYAYDPNMFRLAGMQTQTSTGTIQNFSYQYDNVGNISQITDAVGTNTQTFSY